MEVIILAGGKGTRLQSLVTDRPKPMAPIGNKPFLEILLKHLALYNINQIILSVGYKHKIIKEYFGHSFNNIPIQYSDEESPLGTGGAIKKALNFVADKQVFVINGDTFFDINLSNMYHNFLSKEFNGSVALKKMTDFNRYGAVTISQNKIASFDEKKFYASGYINGGVYLIKKTLFDEFQLPEKFSFETDFLQPHTKEANLQAFHSQGLFIDIGTPNDYRLAQDLLYSQKI